MPEMRFRILWPDGAMENCYSPSLIVKEYLTPGAAYSLVDFLARCRTSLKIASARVEAKYGRPCALALAQLDRIEAGCTRFASLAGASVRIDGFEE